MTTRQVGILGFYLAMYIAIAGCGGGAGDRSTKDPSVRGTVTLDGQPFTDADIAFINPTTKGIIGGGRVTDGAFTFTCPPGSYKVKIQASRQVPGKVVAHMGNAPVWAESLPKIYNDNTILTAEVKDDNNEPFQFEMKSKP